MASPRRQHTSSSTYAYNTTNTSSSSSSARPHYQLPAQYQTTSSSSHQYHPAGYADDYYSRNSSSSHVTPTAGYRDRSTATSTSHQSPHGAFRDYATSSSSTPSARTRHEAISTSSMRQTYYQPDVPDYTLDPYNRYTDRYIPERPKKSSPVSSFYSDSTRQSALTLGQVRGRISKLRARLRRAQTVVELADLYEDAERLRKRMRNVEGQGTMSVRGGMTPFDDLKDELEDIMRQTAESRSPRYPRY